jgi:phospholipid/cholesterol/gamma-HCH transport system permease protein
MKNALNKSNIIDYFGQILIDLVDWRKNENISLPVLINQIRFTGIEALNLISVSSFILGALIMGVGYSQLSSLGQGDWLYDILVLVTVRDLGPILTAFIILIRSGSAITTELGSMRVQGEIDFLEAMGISPISYLIAPRIFGMILSLMLLSLYFMGIGLSGAYLVAGLLWKLPFQDFYTRLFNSLELTDLILMFIKSGFYGLLIGALCSFHGLRVGRASTEIPQRLIRAVTQCILAIIIISAIITSIHLALEAPNG